MVPTLGSRVGYLSQTLRSIVAQTEPVDVVVVVPAGASEARDAAQAHGAKVLDDPGGLSAAVNAGLALARPQHMFANWLGDDDLLEEHSLRRVAAALAGDSAASVAYGHCTYIDPDGRPLWVSRAGRLAPWLLGWGPNLIPQPGMLFRLADFHAVGGLDESLSYTMDLDLLLRLRSRGRLVDVGAPVACFRWHGESLTVSDRSASLREAEMVKRRYLSGTAAVTRPIWEGPVRGATRLAVRALARRASR